MKLRQRKKNIRKFLISKELHRVGKGVQYIYRFPNGIGASVVKFEIYKGIGSYGCEFGLYEMAQLHFINEEQPRIGDIEGYLTSKDVVKKLEQILKVNPRGDF